MIAGPERLLSNSLAGPEPLPYRKNCQRPRSTFCFNCNKKKKVKKDKDSTNHKRKAILKVYLFYMLLTGSIHFSQFLIVHSLKISVLSILDMSKVLSHQQTCTSHRNKPVFPSPRKQSNSVFSAILNSHLKCSILSTAALLYESISKGPARKKPQLYILEFRTHLQKDQSWTCSFHIIFWWNRNWVVPKTEFRNFSSGLMFIHGQVYVQKWRSQFSVPFLKWIKGQINVFLCAINFLKLLKNTVIPEIRSKCSIWLRKRVICRVYL